MDLTLAYRNRSAILSQGGGRVLSFSPNLARDAVAFDGALRDPLRFREAMSALHDVVISDLRFKPRDKTAYERWKVEQAEQMQRLRQHAFQRAREELTGGPPVEVPKELKKAYKSARKYYWSARNRYSNYLYRRDYEIWRLLMPCDPVITVADDVVFFECFSADESSYGCLTVDREHTFTQSESMQLGTTNVDYSWALYNHFQSLRSYRETRFRVDPTGFEVAHGDQRNDAHREEKIDLPDGWLRGFLQLQAAMAMPLRKVTLSRETVYSLLAWLRRHKAARSPRAVRFELTDGQSPTLVLEPWEKHIVSHGTKYRGPNTDPVRVWGRRRLLSLARLLPLAESFDVYLLGTGMPSFWVARMGSMRLTLGLSGWTTNDWTRGSALDALAPPTEMSASMLAQISDDLEERRAAGLDDLCKAHKLEAPECTAALNRLANTGEVIYDLTEKLYRFRRIMPNSLGEASLGPENVEQTEARTITARRLVEIQSFETNDSGFISLEGKAAGKPVRLTLDPDGGMRRGWCVCGHHQKAGLRMGPCRHLLALRSTWMTRQSSSDIKEQVASVKSWFDKLKQWAN